MGARSDDSEVQSDGPWSFIRNSEILMIPKVLCFLAGTMTGATCPLCKDFDGASLTGIRESTRIAI